MSSAALALPDDAAAFLALTVARRALRASRAQLAFARQRMDRGDLSEAAEREWRAAVESHQVAQSMAIHALAAVGRAMGIVEDVEWIGEK